MPQRQINMLNWNDYYPNWPLAGGDNPNFTPQNMPGPGQGTIYPWGSDLSQARHPNWEPWWSNAPRGASVGWYDPTTGMQKPLTMGGPRQGQTTKK